MSNRFGMTAGIDLDSSDREMIQRSPALPRDIERRLDRQLSGIKCLAESVMVTSENQGRISCTATKRVKRLVMDAERLLSLVNDEEMTSMERTIFEEIVRTCLSHMCDTVADTHRALFREVARTSPVGGYGWSRRALLVSRIIAGLRNEDEDG